MDIVVLSTKSPLSYTVYLASSNMSLVPIIRRQMVSSSARTGISRIRSWSPSKIVPIGSSVCLQYFSRTAHHATHPQRWRRSQWCTVDRQLCPLNSITSIVAPTSTQIYQPISRQRPQSGTICYLRWHPISVSSCPDITSVGQSVYDVGDHVLVKNLVRQDRKGGHFIKCWNGFYKISRSYGKNVYQIASDDGNVLKNKVNSCNLKPYIDQDTTPPPTKRHTKSDCDDSSPPPPPTQRLNTHGCNSATMCSSNMAKHGSGCHTSHYYLAIQIRTQGRSSWYTTCAPSGL